MGWLGSQIEGVFISIADVGELGSSCPTLDPHTNVLPSLLAVLKTHRTAWTLALFSPRGWPCSTNGNLRIFLSGMAAGRDNERHMCLIRLNFQNRCLKMSSEAHLCVLIYLSLLGQLASMHFLCSPPSSLLRKLTILTTEKREILRDCKQIPERGDTTAHHHDQKQRKHRKEDNQEDNTGNNCDMLYSKCFRTHCILEAGRAYGNQPRLYHVLSLETLDEAVVVRRTSFSDLQFHRKTC